MKNLVLFSAFLLIISCSDSDKFSDEKRQQMWIDGIAYGIDYDDGKLYLIGILESEINSCISFNNFGDCTVNNCWIINSKYGYISLKNLDACYLKDYLWIIDEDTIPSGENSYNVSYGEHFVKLVMVDTFGDSISESAYIRMDEPLKITLLSPVENYEASRTDRLVFQYRVSGIDIWERNVWKDSVYVSTDENVWEEGKALETNFLRPPLNKQVYYWGVKVSNQDTAFYSEIRSVWIKD